MKSLLLVMLLAFSFVAIFSSACNNTETKTAAATSISKEDSLKTLVEQGSYLAQHVAICMDCHSKRDFSKFSMPPAAGSEGSGASFPFGPGEGVPGEIWAPNISPKHLGDWSDEEIIRAMTRGINRKGDTLFPIMPYNNYARLAKEDLMAIVAYVRTLPSSDSTVPSRKLFIPVSAFPPLPEADLEKNVKPNVSDKVKYGQYLVTMASCGDCHTPRSKDGIPDFSKAFSGGFTFNLPMGKVSVGNITPDSATGIGQWTEEVFVNRFKFNASDEVVNKDHGKQGTVMPWAMYGKMKESDLRAIYAYLRTVAPVSNKVEKWPQ